MALRREDKKKLNNPHGANVGDFFVIKNKECLYYNKDYKIFGLSKSHLNLYFEDKKTNKICGCSQCSIEVHIRDNWGNKIPFLKTIDINLCYIYTDKQYKRMKLIDSILY